MVRVKEVETLLRIRSDMTQLVWRIRRAHGWRCDLTDPPSCLALYSTLVAVAAFEIVVRRQSFTEFSPHSVLLVLLDNVAAVLWPISIKDYLGPPALPMGFRDRDLEAAYQCRVDFRTPDLRPLDLLSSNVANAHQARPV